MRTVLFTYLRTGGGHRAPVRALAQYLEREYPGFVRPVMLDALEHGSAFARRVLEDGYRLLQARARWYYEFLYLTNKIPPVAWFNAALVVPFVRKKLEETIRREQPDRIVVAHFLLVKPVMDILDRHDWRIPVTVLVTDPYTAHPIWFRDLRPGFLLFSDDLRRHCERHGVAPDRLTVMPFVLSDQYRAPLDAERVDAIRRKLGFAPGRKLVLVLGGADGIPRGERILKRLAAGVPGADIAIVCGKNTGLRQNAERIAADTGRSDIRVYGFVDFAFELINAADVVISKCGASTFLEILLSGKIPVITDYLWEQEKGNKDFLERTGSGFFEPRLSRLPRLINRLLTDEPFACGVRENIRKTGLRNGIADVAAFLAGGS